MIIISHWNNLPVPDSPSLGTFNIQLETVPGYLVWRVLLPRMLDQIDDP